MASSKEYLEFILEQLSELDDITYRPMMGEYIIYNHGKVVGGIYDDRLLVKIVDNNKEYNMAKENPYDTAKPMYLVDAVDDKEILKEIVLDTYKEIKKAWILKGKLLESKIFKTRWW